VNWDRATKAIQAQSGTAGWHRHDIRRTVASLMGDLGIAPHVIEVALGHALRSSSDGSGLSRVATTYNTSRYRDEHVDASQRLADELERLQGDSFLCGDPDQYSYEPQHKMYITDLSDVKNPKDLDRLRLSLAQTEWAKSYGRDAIEQLASKLVYPIESARSKLAKLPPKDAGTEPSTQRQRRPGGGRKPDEPKAVLAGAVEQAMQDCGFPDGRWHANGPQGGSPYLQTVAIAWEIASGEPAGMGDVRRLVAESRRWTMVPTAKPA
jgi:hypothetical protein